MKLIFTAEKKNRIFLCYFRGKKFDVMTSNSKTVDEYVDSVPADRKEAIAKLRKVIKKNVPKGFSEVMGYGLPGYVVPHKLYPEGYHCDPKLPLPFMGFASQKNFVALYHMGIYSDEKIMKWFIDEYPKHCKTKLDMGKSCIRFKKVDDIPFELIGELAKKMSVEDWIETYEKHFKR